jgi:hypothetical protein
MQALNPLSDRAPVTPWYNQRWPWFLMLGPVIVIVAGTFTGWLAWSRQDAMVVDDYYKQGKAINQDLRRDRSATALALSVSARYNPASERLEGVLLAAGKPLPTPVRILLAHPTQPAKDLALDAVVDANGRFSVPLPMLERARWTVVVEGGQRAWRLNGGWKWPQQKELTIVADAPAAP